MRASLFGEAAAARCAIHILSESMVRRFRPQFHRPLPVTPLGSPASSAQPLPQLRPHTAAAPPLTWEDLLGHR